MNRAAFFAAIHHAPFGGGISQSQIDGVSAILDEWDRRGLSDIRWLAYMLATTFHETDRAMRPIREYGRGKGMKYGTTYYGRGFVQLTWEKNYKKASAVVGVDLVANPDRALELPFAATIMFDGMLNGWFTAHRLSDYIHGSTCDYVGCRRIINGTDRAVLIAGYATAFEKALRAADTATVGGADVPAVIIPAIANSLPPGYAGVIPAPAKPPISLTSKAAGGVGAVAAAAAAHEAGLSWGWIVIVIVAALVVGGILFVAMKAR